MVQDSNKLGSPSPIRKTLVTNAYDANGNTLSDPSGKSYSWDFENRLTQAVVPGTNGGTTTFNYDPFGRRIQKSGPLGTTNYLYDGFGLLEETDSSGNVLARYSHSDVLDLPLSMLRAGTTVFYQGGWPTFAFCFAPRHHEKGCPSFAAFAKLGITSLDLAAPYAIFQTFSSAFRSSFTSTIPRSPSA